MSASNEGTIHCSTGRHDRAGYIRRLVSLWRAGKSGVFQVRFGRRRQKLFILSGAVVACRAYLESDEERTVKMTGPEGIGAALSWATGEWTFQPMSGVAHAVDPALRPDTALAELWKSVRDNIPASEAMVAVSERGEEAILPGPELAECFPGFEILAPLDGLVEAMGVGASVEALFRTFPDYGPDLARAIWMLEAAGLFDPDDTTYVQCVRALMDVRPYEDAGSIVSGVSRVARTSSPDSAISAVSSASKISRVDRSKGTSSRKPATPRAAPKNPSRDLAGILKAEHERRMGRDYYGFLGVAANAPQLLVNRLCKRYIQRWRSASSNQALPADAQVLSKELFGAIQQVTEVLTDPVRREEYDKLLARGAAPLITTDVTTGASAERDSAPAAVDKPLSEATTAYERGRLLLERGEYATAVRYLEKARVENPSEPDILADLGWASWMLQGTEDAEQAGSEEPVEYIQLAMTFDKSNRRALEYLARIAMAGEDIDYQQKRLKELLRVAPDVEWAREALKSLMFTRKDQTSESGRSLLFWRKGNSH